jgi:hypothetical protein
MGLLIVEMDKGGKFLCKRLFLVDKSRERRFPKRAVGEK